MSLIKGSMRFSEGPSRISENKRVAESLGGGGGGVRIRGEKEEGRRRGEKQTFSATLLA